MVGMIGVEKRKVSRTGTASKWLLGYGYLKEEVQVQSMRWCVLRGGKVLAECRSRKIAEEIADRMIHK